MDHMAGTNLNFTSSSSPALKSARDSELLPPQCPSCRVVSSWDNEDNNHDGDNDEDNDNEPEEHEGDDKFGLLECSCCGWKNSYYLGDEWEEMSGEGILAKGKWWGRKIVVV